MGEAPLPESRAMAEWLNKPETACAFVMKE